ENIVHDEKAQQLHFKNARMEFLGLPVFYTPYLRVPEPGVKRATGLLTPKILTSNLLGVGIKQPFYINLNRTSDITLSILKTTKTKFLVETDYRKIFSNGNLFFSGAAKPDSEKNIIEGYFQLSGNARILDNSSLNYNTTAVSNSGFLGKYGYRNTDRLTSSVELTKQMRHSFSKASTTYFTSLRDNEQEKYVIVPKFYTRHFNHYKNLNIFSGTEISLVGLTKKNFETDLRVNASFDAEKAWKINTGLRIKGSTKISSSLYRINENNTKKNLYKYFDPTFGIELSLPLYKSLKKRLETIKPTLQLVYNPAIKLNDKISNSDSQQVKLDQSSLFSLNRFSGLDKQESGLRLNSGVEYSVENNGPFSYNLALGQVFRGNPSEQFSKESGLSGIKSDILISGKLDYNSLISIHGEQLYDQKLTLRHAETTFHYRQPKSTISSGLIFFEADLTENRPTDLTEFTLGIQSTLNRNWLSSLDLRRNLNEHENINALLKFSYENECAKINLSFKKRFTETDTLPADTSVELTFDLNGLGEKRASFRKSNCLIYN
ncbi:MAG: LPS assembly protein LptD, partial [Paracoccaceae bacterium]|nr:LPS assembly protein LptD [Paracoccaceae bacterium]